MQVIKTPLYAYDQILCTGESVRQWPWHDAHE